VDADEVPSEVTFVRRFVVALGARKSWVYSAIVHQVLYQTVFPFVCLQTLVTLEVMQRPSRVSYKQRIEDKAISASKGFIWTRLPVSV